MKKSILKKLNFGLFSLITFGLSLQAQAGLLERAQVTTYKSGEMQTYLGSDFLYSTGSYDSSGGTKSTYASGDYFYVLQVPFGARYSLSDSWAIQAGFQVGASESKTSDPLYKATRTNSTFNQMMIGTDYLIMTNPVELIPEIKIAYNFENYDNTSDVAMTSEGVMETTAALKAQQKFASIILLGKLGYMYRSGGRSNLMPYSAAAGYDFGQSLLGIELSGFQSVSDDKDKNNTVLRDAAVARTEAGVKRFYSINPSALDLSIFYNLAVGEKFQIDMNVGSVLGGNNFSQGYHGGLWITYNWDLNKVEPYKKEILSAPLNKESQMSTEKGVDVFKEDVHDGVDQSIFKSEPAPKEIQTKNPEPIPAPTTAPTLEKTKKPQPGRQSQLKSPPAKTKAVRTKSLKKNSANSSTTLKKQRVKIENSNPSAPSDSQLQNELDKTEMKIQLKKNK